MMYVYQQLKRLIDEQMVGYMAEYEMLKGRREDREFKVENNYFILMDYHFLTGTG